MSAKMSLELSRRMARCAELAEGTTSACDTQLALVVRGFELAATMDAIIDACDACTPAVRRAWAANYTKVVVLAGDPQKIAGRVPLVTTGRGSIACVGPAPSTALEPLRRLLRPLRTDTSLRCLPAHEWCAMRAADGPSAQLTIATRDAELANVLVHLTHVVAESHMLGLLQSLGALEVSFVRDVVTFESDDLYVRVARSADDPQQLCTYARLVAR